MNNNVKIARELVKLAKSLVATNDMGWNENAIGTCKTEFEKELSNEGNSENKRYKFPLDKETLNNCLEKFDELFKEVMKNATPGTQHSSDLSKKYTEKFTDAPKQCAGILSKIFKKHSSELGLKG